MFIEILREKAATPQLWPMPPQAQRSAKILMEAERPVVLVGSSFLTHPENATLLKLLEKLVEQIHAELILIPDKANLGGAIQLGITNPVSAQSLQDLDVLHLIGETIPASVSSRSFVLYQNICPPESLPDSGLILPAAAFTEELGTFIDQAGEVHEIHRAVQAPGSALPSWQILCLIAQKLGIPGFAYEDESQIRAEMESTSFAPADLDASLLNLFQLESAAFPSNRSDDHAYMGFPLRTWVAGFRTLYPEPTLKIK
jgi:NADH dehydrogenase/NADH:ubiquinone oxidoreductase subunit G